MHLFPKEKCTGWGGINEVKKEGTEAEAPNMMYSKDQRLLRCWSQYCNTSALVCPQGLHSIPRSMPLKHSLLKVTAFYFNIVDRYYLNILEWSGWHIICKFYCKVFILHKNFKMTVPESVDVIP